MSPLVKCLARSIWRINTSALSGLCCQGWVWCLCNGHTRKALAQGVSCFLLWWPAEVWEWFFFFFPDTVSRTNYAPKISRGSLQSPIKCLQVVWFKECCPLRFLNLSLWESLIRNLPFPSLSRKCFNDLFLVIFLVREVTSLDCPVREKGRPSNPMKYFFTFDLRNIQ